MWCDQRHFGSILTAFGWMGFNSLGGLYLYFLMPMVLALDLLELYVIIFFIYLVVSVFSGIINYVIS